MLYPWMSGDVLALHDRLTECVDAPVPVPVKVAVVVEGVALLVNVNVALTEPGVRGLKVMVKEALLPDAIVAGNESPLTVNTELFVLAPVTVTLPFVAVSVPVVVPLLPSTTLPTARVVGLTESWALAAVVPVPVNVAVVVEGVALLVNVSVALAAPVVRGLNVTVNDALLPDAIVTGNESPLTVNAELFVLAPVTVTLPFVAVNVPVVVPLLPSTTLPTAKVVGLTDSWALAAAVPVPVKVAVVVEGVASLVNVNVALAAPVVRGLNVMVNDALLPAAIVTGSESPLTVNAELFVLAPVMVTLPLLAVRVPVVVPLFPSTTLPTANVVGLTDS